MTVDVTGSSRSVSGRGGNMIGAGGVPVTPVSNVGPIPCRAPAFTRNTPVTAFAGTTPCTDVLVADVTVPAMVPNSTRFRAASRLKPDPVIVIGVPAVPLDGTTDVMVTPAGANVARSVYDAVD